jgi:hypothetical protein
MMADRLYVHRTQSLEALLQELWALRPELKDKPSMTVYMGTAALIREAKHSATFMSAGFASSVQAEAAMPELPPATEVAIAFEAVADADELHPNVQWD